MNEPVNVEIGRCAACGEREAVSLSVRDGERGGGVDIVVYCPACGAKRTMQAASMHLVTLQMHAEPTNRQEGTEDADGTEGDGTRAGTGDV